MTSGPKRSRSSSKGSSSPTSGFSADADQPSGEKVNGDVTSHSPGFYPLYNQRGQRKYGPPIDWTKEPPRGTEVHVSKLPRDLLEDELIPVFERVGKIFEVRLMMETPEMNKGFAFVKFFFKEDSEVAISELNDFEIRPKVRIAVRRSVDNNRLFLGNIPKGFFEEDVLQGMKEVSSGVVKVILYASVNDRTKNRGYGFVEFETHQQAKSARNKLKIAPIIWAGQEIKIDWAEPELEVDEETMKKVRVLYVRNLALCTTDQQLRELFSSFGGVIDRVKKIKDYAFVHFAVREQAEEAKAKLQGYSLDNCEIDISWSKPVTNREEYQQRKAASKALSCGAGGVPQLTPAAMGMNGEPILLNQRVRTAAGAQGYIASRPYPPLRPRPNEETFSPLQPSFVYSNFAYVPDMTVRNAIDTIGLATPLPQTVYAPERVNQLEEYLAPTHDLQQYQIAHPQLFPRFQPPLIASTYNMVAASPLTNSWGGQPFIQPGTTTPALLPAAPYVVPTPSYASIPGAFTSQPIFGGQMMTQYPNITGSNMSIDRT